MPKSKQHWGHDLVTLALVGAIAALVFWLVPLPAHAAHSLAGATSCKDVNC
jgi:membrane-associated phospholipid phosphatase